VKKCCLTFLQIPQAEALKIVSLTHIFFRLPSTFPVRTRILTSVLVRLLCLATLKVFYTCINVSDDYL
jgi:hypothetical protein